MCSRRYRPDFRVPSCEPGNSCRQRPELDGPEHMPLRVSTTNPDRSARRGWTCRAPGTGTQPNAEYRAQNRTSSKASHLSKAPTGNIECDDLTVPVRKAHSGTVGADHSQRGFVRSRQIDAKSRWPHAAIHIGRI